MCVVGSWDVCELSMQCAVWCVHAQCMSVHLMQYIYMHVHVHVHYMYTTCIYMYLLFSTVSLVV